MTKKIIVSLFAVIFAFSLVGCGMNSKDNGDKNNNMGDTLSDIASGVTDKTGMTSSTAKITSEEAKAAALKDAGLTEADVTNLTTDLDRDDGVLKYEGYISRQQAQVNEMLRPEMRQIPSDIDYESIKGLRLEAVEKLKRV